MIILLGASGYVGQAFKKEIERRKLDCLYLSRSSIDYTDYETLLKFLKKTKPSFLINAAGYTGKPNVDACELDWSGTLAGNVLFPQAIAHACREVGIPWAQISSGCIYTGAHIVVGGKKRTEKNLNQAAIKSLIKSNSKSIRGFNEKDIPNFSFRNKPCSFYSGSKALGEEVLIAEAVDNYIWRLRIPFNEFDNERNYLSKVQRYAKVYDNANSLSHLADFVKACLDLWEMKAPYGIYNITNPGFVTTRQVVGLIKDILKPKRTFEFWKNDKEFYQKIAKTPRSNCILDVSKLLATGVKIRPVEEALIDSLMKWSNPQP